MPPSAIPPPPLKKQPRPSRAGFFRRIRIGSGVLIQLALLVFIIAAINGYAFKHFRRFDFSRDHNFTLSDRTERFVKSLTQPVRIIVYMAPRDADQEAAVYLNAIEADVTNLIAEYRTANPKQITVETVDPYVNVSRAGEVQAKYKLGQQENVVIVDCGSHTKIITADKLAQIDSSGASMGQPPQISAFTGEQAITAALIEVTEGKKSSAYYVQGHGEPAIGKGKPLETVGSMLDGEHVTVEELNLLNVDKIPADASMVMLFAPHYDLSEREVKLLSDYWDRGGRILLLLDPASPAPRLAAFLNQLGIKPDDDRILRTLDLAGGVTGIVSDAYANFVGDSVIAKQLSGINIVFPGGTQSLSLEPERVAPTNVKLAPLIQAIKGFWGETDYKDLETTGATFDQGKDRPAPLSIAATVEKNAVGDQRVQNGASRMIVVGNAKFVQSDSMTQEGEDFLLSSLNWLLEREQLIGIPPKEVKTLSLNLPESQVQEIFWITILAIPGGIAFIGLLVWWRRRA